MYLGMFGVVYIVLTYFGSYMDPCGLPRWVKYVLRQ